LPRSFGPVVPIYPMPPPPPSLAFLGLWSPFGFKLISLKRSSLQVFLAP
jgi:hypothetical protein